MHWVVVALMLVAFAFFVLISKKGKSRFFAAAFLIAASAALIALVFWGIVRNFGL